MSSFSFIGGIIPGSHPDLQQPKNRPPCGGNWEPRKLWPVQHHPPGREAGRPSERQEAQLTEVKMPAETYDHINTIP